MPKSPVFHKATTTILLDEQATNTLIQTIKEQGIHYLEIDLKDAYQHGGKNYKAEPHNPAILTNLENLLGSLYGNFQIKNITYTLPNDRDPEEQHFVSGIAGAGAFFLGGFAGGIVGRLSSLGHQLIYAPLSDLYTMSKEGLQSYFNINLAPFPLITAVIGGLAGVVYFFKTEDDKMTKMHPSAHCKNFNNAVTTRLHTILVNLEKVSSLNLENFTAKNEEAYTKELATRLKNVINNKENGWTEAQREALWAQYQNAPAGQLLTQKTIPVEPSHLETMIFSTAAGASASTQNTNIRHRRQPPLTHELSDSDSTDSNDTVVVRPA